MSPKDWGATLLERLGLLRLLARGRRDQVVVLAYHRIRGDETPQAPVFDDEVFGPTASAFRAQVQWLARNTELIGESDVFRAVDRGERLPSRSLLVTFDDAYRDNFDLAFPVLRELRAPAIFFVPTRLIEERSVGWWDTIAYLVKQTREEWLDVDGQRLPVAGRAREAIENLHEYMKRAKAADTATFLHRLSAACRVPLPSRQAQDAELMTWEQITQLIRGGMTIGSHTHTHRVLTTLDDAEVRAELRTSKAVLEERLGTPVQSLAYPCGGHGTFDSRSRRLAEECGYRLAFSFTGGTNDPTAISRFDVQRLAASPHPSRLAASVLAPRIFSLASSSAELRLRQSAR